MWAWKEAGAAEGSAPPAGKERIPAKYNRQSELEGGRVGVEQDV